MAKSNHLSSQTLNERSLLQLRQEPTHNRLKFIDDYLEDARRGGEKEYAFVELRIPESNTTTHQRDKSTLSLHGGNVTTCVAPPSCTDHSSPSRHLSHPVTATLIPTLSQSSDPDSLTISLSDASSLLSEAMVEGLISP